MLFTGISKVFKLTDEQQYHTIGRFWDEIAEIYGLENLRGLGYKWHGDELSYAIGLKEGEIKNSNFSISLPDDGWIRVKGRTDSLKELYDAIYQAGTLQYEIEMFNEDGTCEIIYNR